MAGLKWLVKNYRPKTLTAGNIEKQIAQTGIFRGIAPPAEAPRCEKCHNSGRVLERIPEYCDCRMGKDLKAVELRKSSTRDTRIERSKRHPPSPTLGRSSPEADTGS